MPEIKLSGKELLAALVPRLEHGLECIQFLCDLYDHPTKPLVVNADKDSSWDAEQKANAAKFVESVRHGLDDTEGLRGLLAEIEQAEEASELVEHLSTHFSYTLDYPATYELAVAEAKAGRKSLRQRFDRLQERGE